MHAAGRMRRRAVLPGADVVLRLPLRLHGRRGVVRRRLVRGWEVEVREANGLPVHLVLPRRAFRPV